MNDFKEWLSDYLRYFLLILAALLVLALAVIGFRVYQAVTSPNLGDADSIEILTEPETMTDSESESVPTTETEQTAESKAEEETADSHAAQTDQTLTDGETAVGASDNTAAQQEETTDQTNTAEQTQVPSEVETSAPAETAAATEPAYEPIYKTLKGSCYIRSGPSMEADIIGEYMYGTTVEFLEDVGGWYKVQIDGMVGYMGARFF